MGREAPEEIARLFERVARGVTKDANERNDAGEARGGARGEKKSTFARLLVLS